MDDDELVIEVLQPARHNRWAVIVPALGLVSEVAQAVSDTFRAYTVYAAQHSMQLHYDQKFREVVNGGYSSIGPGEVLPED